MEKVHRRIYSHSANLIIDGARVLNAIVCLKLQRVARLVLSVA